MGVEGLLQRIREIPGTAALASLSHPDGCDLDDDLAVDEIARHLLGRFRDHQDIDAFTLLFELTHDRLAVSATRITRQLSPAVDPEDLVAGFMARLFCDVGRRREVRRFLGLAHTAMRNEVLDQLRGLRRAQVKQRGWHRTQELPADPLEELTDAEERATLERCGEMLLGITVDCFGQLEQRDQQVLVAREILQLPYVRVAAMLQLADDQVGMIIRRARQHLVKRILSRLASERRDEPDPIRADAWERLGNSFGDVLAPPGRGAGIEVLMQRMLERSADTARARLADLIYELAKACLVTRMSFSDRTMVHDVPRHSGVVADDIRLVAERLERVDATEGRVDLADVVTARPSRDSALAEAERCLAHLEELEGRTGRQQVALALCRIHDGRADDGEAILRSLLSENVPLAPLTRQNVSRNLTLALLRQDRFAEALSEVDQAAATWPDDPVRVMNECFASARLGDRSRFRGAAQQLIELQASEPSALVQSWIEGPLRNLADDVGLPPGRIDDLIGSAETTDGEES